MRTRQDRRLLAIAAFALALAIIGPSARLWAEEPSAASTESAKHSPWSLHAELDLFLGLRAGAEYSFTDALGLRGSFGACLISPLKMSYTLVGVSHLMPRRKTLQLDLEYGLVYADFNVLEPVLDLDPKIDWPSAYWMPGASLSIGCRTRGGNVFSFRAGGGYLFGYDMNMWVKPTVMPLIALQYDYKP
jgi:hypothetical protein